MVRVDESPPAADKPTPPDEVVMRRALTLGESVRGSTSPNPWVGAIVVPAPRPGDDRPTPLYEGATAPPGGPHAEVRAIESARVDGRAAGAVLYTTLEPCAHTGRTGACVSAIVAAGIRRVVVGVSDPDPQVAGRGMAELRAAGVEVTLGVGAREVEASLAPYLKHRRTGMPWVVLKLAATLDGRIAAADGSSRWITGSEARADVHRLRAMSDAVLVGAGTVRDDDPELTVRTEPPATRQPLRVVLGQAPEHARVRPALELSGDLGEVLQTLGGLGVMQLLVEGGARVAKSFHEARLVDRYVVYLAPAIAGGDDGPGLFAGPGARTVDDLWRGTILSVERLGEDLRLEVAA